MRRVLTLVAAALVLVAVAAPSAPARHTVAHRLSQLETKVNRLQRRTEALQRRTAALSAFAHDCLAWDWAPIGWYGDDQNRSFGYVFDNDGDGPAEPFWAGALDIAGRPEETSFVIAIINPACVRQIARRTAALHGRASRFPAFAKEPPGA